MKKALFVTGILLGLAVFAAFTPGQAVAEPPPQNKLLEIPIGVTQADVTDDGRPDIIIRMWMEKIFFPDQYSAIIFLEENSYINEEFSPVFSTIQKDLKDDYWEKENHKNILVKIQDENGNIEHQIQTPIHSECMMEDYRLAYNYRNHFYLIRATIGSDWKCKRGPAKFEILQPADLYSEDELSEDAAGTGFVIVKKLLTDEEYSDVKTAFESNEGRLIGMIQ